MAVPLEHGEKSIEPWLCRPCIALTKTVEKWELKDSLRLPLCKVELTQASMAFIPYFLREVGCLPSDYLMGK